VRSAKSFAQYGADHAEVEIAGAHGAAVIKASGKGGIFQSLWELGEESRVGMEIAAKDIPIRQETIEIAEYYGIHPYKLEGAGSYLIAAADGTGLKKKLSDACISASIIGKVTGGNDRILYVDGVKRYLEPVRAAENKNACPDSIQ
ncbi:MAG: hydrogenase maturation factor, partial [Lachnospiraceae bacterium]|nr:hydrogenase maturation factor [Lachnospiraceae bacterium]